MEQLRWGEKCVQFQCSFELTCFRQQNIRGQSRPPRLHAICITMFQCRCVLQSQKISKIVHSIWNGEKTDFKIELFEYQEPRMTGFAKQPPHWNAVPIKSKSTLFLKHFRFWRFRCEMSTVLCSVSKMVLGLIVFLHFFQQAYADRVYRPVLYVHDFCIRVTFFDDGGEEFFTFRFISSTFLSSFVNSFTVCLVSVFFVHVSTYLWL